MVVERTPRTCFVTIGATARFDSLIKAVLSPPFLQSLYAFGYTALILQHGTEGAQIYHDFMTANKAGSNGRFGLDISGFDFNKRGLGAEMQAAKGRTGTAEGVVISHAGVLDCPILDGSKDSRNPKVPDQYLMRFELQFP